MLDTAMSATTLAQSLSEGILLGIPDRPASSGDRRPRSPVFRTGFKRALPKLVRRCARDAFVFSRWFV